jgi:hypothetical protein
MSTLDALDRHIRSIVSGRRWIVTADAAAATAHMVSRMKALDVDDVVVVSAAVGIGDPPDCDVIWTEPGGGTSLMDGIRAFERAVRDPTAELMAEIDRYDPDRAAWIVAGPFDTGTVLLDRRLYGARREAWAGLEDKLAILDVWEAAGIPVAPSRVVPVDAAAVAAEALDSGDGTVWAADNSRGWHGGAEGTRWVAPSTDAVAAATAWARDLSRRVRIMPFLEGVPCSIHAFVTDSGTARFRPIELLTFRTSSHDFVYGGLASTWEPPDALRREMRDVAGAVAAVIRERVGYLGAFSVDGVATIDGFRPTEVNPRLSAGLGIQATVVDRLDLGWITRCVIEGDVAVDHEWLERIVLRTAETRRSGRLTLALSVPTEPREVRIDFRDGEAVVDDPGSATLAVRPGPAGPVLFMTFHEDALPAHERLAPYAIATAELASRLWNLEIGELTVAPDVHPS